MLFCIFLKALLGEEVMERLMAEAVAVAKRGEIDLVAGLQGCERSPLMARMLAFRRSRRCSTPAETGYSRR